MRWRDCLRGLADVDWSVRPHLYWIIFLTAVSRMPFLNSGFGWDDDAWLVALRAYDLRHSGVYLPSRFPGYPLYEYTNSLLVDFGWVATNGATLVFSIFVVLVFALVLKEMRCRNRGLLVLCFAFLPVLWKNGAITMDYMWALTFVLLSWLLTIRKTYWAAGIMMGLAIGTRLSSAIMLLPFAYLLWTLRPNTTELVKYYAAAVAIPGLLFIPLYLEYGLGFLTYAKIEISALAIPVRMARVTGALPMLFLVMVCALRWKAVLSALKARDRTNLFLGFVLLVHVALFVRLPLEPEYWMLATPFALVLFSRLADRRSLTLLLVLFLSAAFVNPDVTLDSEDALAFSYDGIVIGEWFDRVDQLDRAQRIMDLEIPDHSAMILGRYAMVVAYLDDDLSCDPDRRVMWESGQIIDYERDIIIAYKMELSEVQEFQADGRTIFYLPEWEKYTLEGEGFSLSEEGCIPLDV